jgi:hypothetical protein
MSPTRVKISKQKIDSANQRFPSEFITQLLSPNFKGVWIFGTQHDYANWMTSHSENLIREYRGGYNNNTRRWTFPTGTLTLRVLNEVRDLEVFRGQIFNYIGVSGSINPTIQQAVSDYITMNIGRKL